mmetsp:Transcript_20819/g.45316  ORF Transcript_20819/g.45316 Transcript_20819/m.45316 type:complete len:164 (-) Transcript_20819:19-510(-)
MSCIIQGSPVIAVLMFSSLFAALAVRNDHISEVLTGAVTFEEEGAPGSAVCNVLFKVYNSHSLGRYKHKVDKFYALSDQWQRFSGRDKICKHAVYLEAMTRGRAIVTSCGDYADDDNWEDEMYLSQIQDEMARLEHLMGEAEAAGERERPPIRQANEGCAKTN